MYGVRIIRASQELVQEQVISSSLCLGVDFTESEKFPALVVKPKNIKYKDISCGENNMMMIDGI